ncbi:MAG: SH3 domain-containing protein, partial [Anaerolineae bacterium]
MKSPTIYLILISMLLMAGCREAAPTPVAPETAVVSAVTPTIAPTETATARPTNTPLPTDTPAPTFTFTPSATPLPLLVVSVQDKADETFLPDGRILLDNADLTFHAEQSVNAHGQATFADLVVGETYTVTVQADGYLDAVLPVEFVAGGSELEVGLEAGTFVTVTGEDASLRSGPGTVYGRIGTIEAGAVLQVVGRDESGDWLLVLTADGEEAWLAASLVDVEGVDMAAVTAVAAPATPTPAPTTVAAVPVVQPPAVPVILAGNLLQNPSFENGELGWNNVRLYDTHDNPQFVHSGTYAVLTIGYNAQSVFNIVPGQTYRAGAWVKVWSSTGEDRTVSENPSDFAARLCINPMNETDPNRETNVCTDFVRPLDTWQYI